MLDQGALLLLLEHDDGQQQLLSMQEALHMMVRTLISYEGLLLTAVLGLSALVVVKAVLLLLVDTPGSLGTVL